MQILENKKRFLINLIICIQSLIKNKYIEFTKK